MEQVEARQVEIGQVVPNFTLPSLEGGQVSATDFKQKCNLVLVYVDLNRCGGCTNLLREFADNYHVYRDLETEILAICPGSFPEVQSRLGSMGLPFRVLLDEQGAFARVYLGSEPGQGQVAAIFVTDRYGALRTEWRGQSETDLPNQESILDWLSLIEMECPECGPGDTSFNRP